jgi:hypothetical protein
MAWRSHGATNRELIENLWNNKLIKDPRVKEAFLKVPFPLPLILSHLLTYPLG